MKCRNETGAEGFFVLSRRLRFLFTIAATNFSDSDVSLDVGSVLLNNKVFVTF